MQEAGAALSSGFTQGWIKPIIGTQYKPDQVIQAHEEVIAHSKGSSGKILINFT